MSTADGSSVDPDELAALAALEDQRNFLLGSLDDLDREHEFGDLDDDDYQALHDDYTVRAAQVLRAIESHRALIDDSRPPRNWTKAIAWVLGVTLLAGVGGWSVAHFSGAKSTSATAASPVTRCIGLTQQFIGGRSGSGAKPDPIVAIKCYKSVLATDPHDETALAYEGWTWALLGRQLSGQVAKSDIDGFVAQASASLQASLKANPRYPDALVFSSINALWQGDLPRSRAFLARFDALKLPASSDMSQLVNSLLRPQLDAPTTSTTTPSQVPSLTTVPPTDATN